MNAIMHAISGNAQPGFGVVTRPDGIHVHVDRHAVLPANRLTNAFGLGRAQAGPARGRDDPHNAVKFSLSTTRNRWQEEARLLFSSTYVEKTQRIVNSLLKVLVPPAMEEEKLRQKQAQEERMRLQEEAAEKERQERIAREEEERERKRKEEEENVRQQAQREQEEAERQAAGIDEPMEDVQDTETAPEEAAEPEPAEPAQRVHTTIRGRQLDITGLEIDSEYLEALPEELREEVIMQQLAETALAGPLPLVKNLPRSTKSSSRPFLPRSGKSYSSRRLLIDAAGNVRLHADRLQPQPPRPAQRIWMLPASLLPSIPRCARRSLPTNLKMSSQAWVQSTSRRPEALGGRRMAQFGDMSAVEHRPRNDTADGQEPKKPQRRQIVQMLDKAGVATLLRLMFMPLQGNTRHQLNDILHNVCENRQNRSEVISLLLSVLQDGSVDSSAIERSFSHLSLRAKAPGAPKTPQSAKRNASLQTSWSLSTEVTPIHGGAAVSEPAVLPFPIQPSHCLVLPNGT